MSDVSSNIRAIIKEIFLYVRKKSHKITKVVKLDILLGAISEFRSISAWNSC